MPGASGCCRFDASDRALTFTGFLNCVTMPRPEYGDSFVVSPMRKLYGSNTTSS